MTFESYHGTPKGSYVRTTRFDFFNREYGDDLMLQGYLKEWKTKTTGGKSKYQEAYGKFFETEKGCQHAYRLLDNKNWKTTEKVTKALWNDLFV